MVDGISLQEIEALTAQPHFVVELFKVASPGLRKRLEKAIHDTVVGDAEAEEACRNGAKNLLHIRRRTLVDRPDSVIAEIDQEGDSHLKFDSLLALISDTMASRGQSDFKQVVHMILARSHLIFECDRCTLFILDNYQNDLLGFYTVDGMQACASALEPSGELQELRIPIQGIAGLVASSGVLINVTDAQNDERFSKATDLKTGYCTKTILCAPLTSSQGKVIAVLQCINKHDELQFTRGDQNMLGTISALLSDFLQRAVLAGTYEAFLKSNDSVHKDIKDMFREFGGEDDVSAEDRCKSGHDLDFSRDRRDSGTESTIGDAIRKLDLEPAMLRWDLDTETLLEGDKSTAYIHACLDHFNLMEEFGLRPDKLEKCLHSISTRYFEKSVYHNWGHAVCTFHNVFSLLGSAALHGTMPRAEMLAVMLAAIGHDVEHPGYNNTFLINNQDHLALRYNDASVLENHHSSVTCSIFMTSERKLFANVDVALVRHIRKVIVLCILGTDMAKHQEAVSWLEQCPTDIKEIRKNGTTLEGEVAIKMGVNLVHCADLVHPALPWKIHKRLSVLCAEEFYQQYKEEQRLGLPSLPFMGKDPKDICGLAPTQVGFIQFVVMPLWSALNSAVGEEKLRAAITNVETNKNAWQRMADTKEVPEDQPFEPVPSAFN